MTNLLFRNPHYYAGSMVAKLTINWVTLVWSMLVLSQESALKGTSYGWIANFVHEDVVARVGLLISLVQFLWLGFKLPPLHYRGWHWGSTGYGVLAFWWIFVLYNILLAVPIQPTAVSAMSAVCIFAVVAFVTNPKECFCANPDR